MARRTLPERTEQLHTRISSGEALMLDEVAARLGRTRSDVVRDLIKRAYTSTLSPNLTEAPSR